MVEEGDVCTLPIEGRGVSEEGRSWSEVEGDKADGRPEVVDCSLLSGGEDRSGMDDAEGPGSESSEVTTGGVEMEGSTCRGSPTVLGVVKEVNDNADEHEDNITSAGGSDESDIGWESSVVPAEVLIDTGVAVTTATTISLDLLLSSFLLFSEC